MSLSDALNDALDRAPSSDAGSVEVHRDGASATIDVEVIGPIGVRLRGLRVTRARAAPIETVTAALPERLHSLPAPVTVVEVDPRLGGATLRSRVDPLRGDYYQVDVRDREASVRRVRVHDGERTQADFSLTRDALGDLLDVLSDPAEPT